MTPVRLLPLVMLTATIALVSERAASQGTALTTPVRKGLRARIEGLVIDAPRRRSGSGGGAASSCTASR